MMKRFLMGAVLLVGMAAPALAQVTPAQIAGTYTYTGTDTDGSAYSESGKVTVKAAPSGALEIVYDGGDYVGVGQVTGNVLAIAAVADGKNSIMLLNVNPDGTLTGKWWRRKDAGAKGTESWKKQ